MFSLQTEIEIEASTRTVWSIIADLEAYPTWNPFVIAASGILRERERLRVRIKPPGARGMTFRPKIIVLDPERELRWLGHLFVPGLFDGEHIFQLEPLGRRRCRLVHGEEFRGILAPLLRDSLIRNTMPGFEAMNRAVKMRAEVMEPTREAENGRQESVSPDSMA